MAREHDHLAGIFVGESDENLLAMEEALIALERAPEDTAHLDAIFRVVHTLKGGAATLGWEALAAFAHLLEDALALFRDGTVELTPVRVTILLQAADALRGLVHSSEAGHATRLRASDRQLVYRLLPPEHRPALATGGIAPDDDSPERPVEAPASGLPQRARSLRIAMDKLDALLDLTGEITVARSRMMQLLQRRAATIGDDVHAGAEELDRLLGDLQERVMQFRLVPLGPTFRQHERTVRDVAASHGKLAQLHIEGGEVEVDAAVVELLRDPLTHLIRNALDHGVEYPASRVAAGKSPCGTITLQARHERGSVVVTLGDDGAGLDRDRILAKARAQGFVGDGVSLSDLDVFHLLTMPGFSTAERVTDLSGRGVGLDVVRRNIESLRGSIAIRSLPGQGTTFELRLPLTLAIIQGLCVAVGAGTYVIPLDAVTECLDLPTEARDDRQASGVLNLRGEPLSYLRLDDRLDGGGRPRPHRQNVVVVRDAIGHAGLVVDAVLGELQAVVKPLGELFQGLTGISGSTVLGDGRVALILDVGSLLSETRASAVAADRPAGPARYIRRPDGGVLT